jgi:serine/threonine-protein kinase
MDPDSSHFASLSAHIDALLERDPGERAAWIDALALREPDVAARLRELLAARDAASAASFLGGHADPALLPPGGVAGESLGPWTLVEPLGEGGMGSVWRATRNDGRFEGEAAIKLLRTGLFSASSQQRFRREGAILARLRHPGIAQLFDAGVTSRGQPFLVLEYVPGDRIDRWCDARELPVAARVNLVARVADAVSTAHSQLVIHRDLKAANILVTATGEPKLLDFGIAGLMDEGSPGLTREGAFALTPESAAPEQFRREPLTVATDVYALGVLAYELLVGVHPSGLAGGAPVDYLQASVEGPRARASVACRDERAGVPSACARAAARAATPRELAATLAGDLDVILAKALAPSPTDRYASMREFAEDLRRHLRSEPVAARRPDLAYRIRKLLRRRPVESALTAVALLAIVVGFCTTLWQWRLAEAQRRIATTERVRAERMLARSLIANDFTHSLMGDLAQVQHPARFLDVLERGERFALGHVDADPAQRARVLLEIADFRLSGEDAAGAGPVAERAARIALEAGDRPLAAIATCDHALASAEEGRGDAADTEIVGALAMAGDDPEALTRCFIARGWAASTGGRGAPTLEYAKQAANAVSRMPWTSPAIAVELLDLRANGENLVGDFRSADAHFREALALLDRAGRGEGLQAGTLWNNLANNLDSQGRLPESLDAYRRSVKISRDILGEDGVAVASWTNLGRALARLGEYEEAWTVTERGLVAARRAHDGIAQFYGPITLANIRREQRRFPEARSLLATAALHRGDEPPGSMLQASLDLGYTTIDIADGHPVEALGRLDRLLADIERYEREHRTHEVSEVFSQRLAMVRAEALGGAGHHPEAIAEARRSVALARGQQGSTPLSADAASALALLARLQAQAGDTGGAAATARQAIPELRGTYGPRHALTRQTLALIPGAPPP